MFQPTQYRAKATEYGDLAKSSADSSQSRDFRKLEQRFTVLADNEQWLADNYQSTVTGPVPDPSNGITLADNYQSTVTAPEQDRSNGITLADEEERILRCLGAAVIMQWNTIPTKLQRELFDTAGSLGNVLQTVALRGQIARFLHNHKDEEKSADYMAKPNDERKA